MAIEQPNELPDSNLIWRSLDHIRRVAFAILDGRLRRDLFHIGTWTKASQSVGSAGDLKDRNSSIAGGIDSLRRQVSEGALDEESRHVALEAASKLVRALQRPEEIVMKQSFEVNKRPRDCV